MRLNLSSQIVLNKVPVEYYKPKTTVEYSEISRMEKIHTDIFASIARRRTVMSPTSIEKLVSRRHSRKANSM